MANKIYIARDEGQTLEDDKKLKGELHIFYDTPELKYDFEKRIWCFKNARVICKVPSYMYPNIKEKELAIFTREFNNK